MIRLKIVGIVAGAIAALAISATPALASWESNSAQTTGTAKVISEGVFKYPGNGEFKCPASEIVAQWQILGAGQIKEAQPKRTTKGPRLQIQIKSWGKNCTAFGSPVTVSECSLQLVAQEGNFSATSGVSVAPCAFKIALLSCTMQIPVGMETSQRSGKGINVGLKEVALSNSGSNQIDKVSITKTAGGQGQLPGEGIFEQASGGCLSTTPTEEAEWTGLEFEAAGVKAV